MVNREGRGWITRRSSRCCGLSRSWITGCWSNTSMTNLMETCRGGVFVVLEQQVRTLERRRGAAGETHTHFEKEKKKSRVDQWEREKSLDESKRITDKKNASNKCLSCRGRHGSGVAMVGSWDFPLRLKDVLGDGSPRFLSPWCWMTPEQKRGKKNRVAKVRCTSQSPWWTGNITFVGPPRSGTFQPQAPDIGISVGRDMPQPDWSSGLERDESFSSEYIPAFV